MKGLYSLFAAVVAIVISAFLLSVLYLVTVGGYLDPLEFRRPPSELTSVPADVRQPAEETSSSLNWAGYVADGDTYTSVTGTWYVPAASSSVLNDAAHATWVGIGGVRSRDLIQAGTEALVGSEGTTYAAWYELLPDASHIVPLSVQSGDSVTVTITERSPSRWAIEFRNNTTGKSYSLEKMYASSRSSAEWIQEMPAAVRGTLSLAHFSPVVFTDASAVNATGDVHTLSSAQSTAVSMVNRDGGRLAIPSVLGVDEKSFSIARTDTEVSSSRSGPSMPAGMPPPAMGLMPPPPIFLLDILGL